MSVRSAHPSIPNYAPTHENMLGQCWKWSYGPANLVCNGDRKQTNNKLNAFTTRVDTFDSVITVGTHAFKTKGLQLGVGTSEIRRIPVIRAGLANLFPISGKPFGTTLERLTDRVSLELTPSILVPLVKRRSIRNLYKGEYTYR
ncbi:hypothetical protein PoB_001624600 [Plakobranchus ocellatus]|uniref:Uncharacterized protein n=1 Tax=Plakobranchus ocellatus TaxID=259542 RepID=A0AAV3Z567_9GAST|nr:hypothetical protein PoB_001624600 [Plakobranchus ocellatus]